MENPKQLLLQQWLQKLPPCGPRHTGREGFCEYLHSNVLQQLPHDTEGLLQFRLGLWLWRFHVPLWGFFQIYLVSLKPWKNCRFSSTRAGRLRRVLTPEGSDGILLTYCKRYRLSHPDHRLLSLHFPCSSPGNFKSSDLFWRLGTERWESPEKADRCGEKITRLNRIVGKCVWSWRLTDGEPSHLLLLLLLLQQLQRE